MNVYNIQRYLERRLAGTGVDSACIYRAITEAIQTKAELEWETEAELVRWVIIQLQLSQSKSQDKHIISAIAGILSQRRLSFAERLSEMEYLIGAKEPGA